jgi:hypothetical protein
MNPLLNTAVFLLSALLASGNASGAASQYHFTVRMAGPDEISRDLDSGIRGQAQFQFSQDFSRLGFTLRLTDSRDLTEVHLHCGATGTEGPAVVPLFSLAEPRRGGLNGTVKVAGTLTSANLIPDARCGTNGTEAIRNLVELARAMSQGRIYLNAHSVNYPEGVVRGQIDGRWPKNSIPHFSGTTTRGSVAVTTVSRCSSSSSSSGTGRQTHHCSR